jgi:micrococcal nuclease
MIAGSAGATEITGTPGNIVDGDTLWVCDQSACHKIRLCGIDAPELSDRRGPAARRALQNLVGSSVMNCMPVGEGTVCDGRSRPTSYDRIVAHCFVHGRDLAAEMVSAGQACDWIAFSGGAYSQEGQATRCQR